MPDGTRLRRRPVEPDARIRKRFARRQWARRWLAWRVVVAGLLVAAAVAGVVWLVFFSSVLDVEDVEIEGNNMLTDDRLRRAAAVPTGEPLALADLDAIRARVEALPAVESVDVSREWPHAVLLDVTEREAVAVIDVDGRLRGMDETGVVFRTYATRPPGMPRIRVAADTRGEAMAEGAAVVRALPPAVAKRVDFVELRTVDQISLKLRDGRTVVWGSAEQSEDKARVLGPLLGIEGTRYDVSVPGQPTVR
jgi:cell division protein FtsQ